MKPGRNDLCPCGSGKKYKKCCYQTGEDPVLKNILESGDIPDEDDYFDDDDRYDDEEEDDEMHKQLLAGITNIRMYLMKKKPQIREYTRIRKMHSEIVNAMVQYQYDGKFNIVIDKDFNSGSLNKNGEKPNLLGVDFDTETPVRANAFYNVFLYKNVPNMNCITEDFIKNNRYKLPEKIEFLHSMLNSEQGLFEVTGTDFEEGYVNIKNVFTGAEQTIIDIGLSGQKNYDEYYLYTRIITHRGISFGTGLNLVFGKTDRFIKKHIQEHKKDFNPNGEFMRFIQLYNRYSKDINRVRTTTNSLG